MKIVINIPEQVYEDCLEYRDMDNTTIYNAIRNGTPLPKNHGRLIDVNTLKDSIIMLNLKGDTNITRYEYKIIENVIFKMPTVIKADNNIERG